MLIKSLSHLCRFLSESNIDYSKWGKNEYKSINDLYLEIVNGDCMIEDGPVRQISISVVNISVDEYILYEKGQMMKSGSYRKRNKLPREKIKVGEGANNAAIRCMKEELGLQRDEYEILSVAKEPIVYVKESASYPNLKTRYLQYDVIVGTKALPSSDFETNESGDIHDPVMAHYWEWIKDDK